jgi:hypothetical protein
VIRGWKKSKLPVCSCDHDGLERLRRRKQLAPGAATEPFVDLRFEGEYRAAIVSAWSSHGKAIPLPTLNCTHGTANILRDFFP